MASAKAIACAIFYRDNNLRPLSIAYDLLVPESWWCFTHADVYGFYSSSAGHRKVFSILPTHVSNHLFSIWPKQNMYSSHDNFAQKVKIYIISDNLIDLHYITLYKTFIMSDHL